MLQSVYTVDDYEAILYRLLAERPIEFNISHKKMPTWKEHTAFLASNPYPVWYFIDHVVGTIYLTAKYEIGIFIFKEFQRQGYASAAIKELMAKHGDGPYCANIHPNNVASIKLFEKFGFKHIQNTYRLETTD